MPPLRAREVFATDRFQVVRLLGKGGMGEVYEALDLKLNTRVALKLLPDAWGDNLLRFKNEFRALQGLQHPNLVSLGELIEHDGRWFFSMELIRGVDFLTHVRGSESGRATHATTQTTQTRPRSTASGAASPASAGEAFDEARLRDGLDQLLQGLAALHRANFVHRDVKPANVMVGRDGRVVLLDFGLITDRDGVESGARGDGAGTKMYMAPEQTMGLPARPASDLYAVGVVMHEALTGRLPVMGAEITGILATDLADICRDLLRIDPRRRPTLDEVQRRLGNESAEQDAVSSIPEQVVGREREMALLADALAESLAGRAVTVLLHGESGVGKTSLIAELARRSDEAGHLVLRGRCFEHESLPYKGVDGVIDALARHLAILPAEEADALVPAGARVLATAFPVLFHVDAFARSEPIPRLHDPAAARARLFATLRDLLRSLAARQPLIVTIDDMHWADEESRTLLREVLAAPDAPPLLLMLSARERVDLFPDGNEALREVELGPLDPSAAAELARTALVRMGAPDHEAADAIAAEAGGHPLYISELARLAASPTGRAQPPRLRDAILRRVAALEEDAQRLLQLVALGARPLPADAVREAADLDAAGYARLVRTLRNTNLVRCLSDPAPTVEPYHDHVREGVADSLSDETCRAHHGRLADALVAREASLPPELLLHHLEAAGRLSEGATYADEAARRASDVFAFARSAELSRIAIRLGDHGVPELRALRRRLAEALIYAGQGRSAAETYLLAAEGADPTTRLDLRARAARAFVSTGHIKEGLATIDLVLDELGIRMPRSQGAAVISFLWQRAKLALRGRRWRTRSEDELPKHELARVDALRVVSEALGPVDPVHANVLLQRHLSMALRLGEPKRVVRALSADAVFMAPQGKRQLARARQLASDTTRYRAGLGTDVFTTVQGPVLGALSYFGGEFERAAGELADAEQTCRSAESYDPMEMSTIRLLWVGALRELGAFERWRRLLPRFLKEADERGDLLAATSIRRVSFLVGLADDEPARTVRELEGTSWPTPAGRIHTQDWFELQARVETALYEGKVAEVSTWALDRLERLRRSLLYLARPLRYRANGLRARVHLALAVDRHPSPHALRQATRLAKKMRRDRAAHADVWALLIDAAVATQRHDAPRAVALLEQAQRGADELGLGLCASAARVRRAALIGGDAGRALMAEAEAWQAREGVVDLARMVEVVAPGFEARP